MNIAVAAGTLLLAVVALAGTFFWWRAGHASEVEGLAADCYNFLAEVIAQGGVPQERYLTAERRNVESELEHRARRLRDRRLRKLVKAALAEYRTTSALSRLPTPRVISLAGLEPSARDKAIERSRASQHAAACKALDAFDLVLARVHDLNRWTTTSP